MKIIIGICIFCLVLFLYLHIQFHLKIGEDLEMYEIEQPSKEKLEEICDLRQPVIFDFECQKIIDTSNLNYISNNYHAFEVKIRNVKENDNNIELYIPLQIHLATKLFKENYNLVHEYVLNMILNIIIKMILLLLIIKLIIQNINYHY